MVVVVADRSKNNKVYKYEDWHLAPDFDGKSDPLDLEQHTVHNLMEIKDALMLQK